MTDSTQATAATEGELNMTPLTPDEAWEALGLDKAPFEDDPLDYTDADQKSKSVFLNGERWAVMVLRKGRI